jgi:hypothetical protein
MDKVNRYIALSRKDVSNGIERKGNLDYLSWAYAWNALVEEYPDSTYYFGEPITFPDGSIMVKAGVTVRDITHEMQLPVMDHRNKAIQSPNARDISDAQMRCFVKAIAMHGVGIGLYLGDLKHVVDKSTYEKAEQLLTAQDSMGFHEFVHKSLSEQERVDTFNDAPAGRKSAFKAEWRALLKVADSFLDEVAAAIADATSADDVSLLQETIAELSTYERQAVWGRLSPAEQEFVKQARNAA